MARVGTTLIAGGKRLVFRETRESTNGARLAFDEFVAPGEGPVPAHIHPHQSERFTIVRGTLGVRVNGETRVLRAGESVLVEPGVPHTYWNAGKDELHHVVALEPALDHETFFESVYGLAREGFSPEHRTVVNLLRLARLFGQHDNWLAGPPVALQRPLFRALGTVARLVGVRVWKPEYADPAPRPL